MENKNMFILGGSEEQLPLVKKAKERGFITHVFDIKEQCVCSKIADYFYPQSIQDSLAILQKAWEIRPKFVLSMSSEIGNKTANFVSNKLHLMANSLQTGIGTTEKDEMKNVFRRHKIPTPMAYPVKSAAECKSLGLDYPFLIKATDQSGSKGVILVKNENELEKAIEEALDASFNKRVIAEEFYEGRQYSVEGISFQGKHQIVGLTEQYYSEPPYFVELQHFLQARLSTELTEKIQKTVFNALSALGVQIGASHTEVLVSPSGEVKILEVASRSGGGFRHELIELSNGNDLIGLMLDSYMGKAPELRKNQEEKFALLKYICCKEDYKKHQRIKEKYGDLIVREDIDFTEDEFFPKDESERRGYYILNFTDKNLIDKLLH